MMTTGNSSPFALCMRHHQHVAVLRARLFVGVRQQRELIDEARERRLAAAALVFARGRDELHQVFDAPLGLFAVLVAQVLQIAAPVEHLAEQQRHGRLRRRHRRQLDEEVAEDRQGRERPRRQQPAVERERQLRP